MFDFLDDAYTPDAVILGDGDFPTSRIPKSLLDRAKYLCCCDHAALALISRGTVPDAIVGDGDSLPDKFKSRYHNLLHFECGQDDNDLTKATRFCASQGHRRIAYLGATGRREDHTIGNIALVTHYLHDLCLEPIMFTDYGVFIPAEGNASFHTFERQQVSLFNMTCSNLKSSGLKWPAYATKMWWQGTLNEALGKEVRIEADGIYLVYLTYEPKTTNPITENK